MKNELLNFLNRFPFIFQYFHSTPTLNQHYCKLFSNRKIDGQKKCFLNGFVRFVDLNALVDFCTDQARLILFFSGEFFPNARTC